MKSSTDGTTTAQRESAREHVAGYHDRTLIDSADHVALNRLTARWFDLNRDDFATAFAEDVCGDWGTVAEAKRAAMDAWCAEQLRLAYATGTLPLPERLNND